MLDKIYSKIMSHKIWVIKCWFRHVNSINTILQNIEFYIFSRYDELNVSDTTSSVSHMLDGQQSSVMQDLAINVNQFDPQI